MRVRRFAALLRHQDPGFIWIQDSHHVAAHRLYWVSDSYHDRLFRRPLTLGLEWFTRGNLQAVSWKDELTAATAEAVKFSGLKQPAEWTEYTS